MKNQKEKMLKKTENRIKSDVAANRLYVLFFAAVALIFGIVKISNSYDAQVLFLNKIQPVCAIVLGILLIGAIVYRFIRFRQAKDESQTMLSSSFLLVLFAGLFAVVTFYRRGISNEALLAFIIIGTLLFFIYSVYEKEFFWYSLYTAIGYAVLNSGFELKYNSGAWRWTVSFGQVFVSIAVIILAVAVVLIAVFAKQRHGKVLLFGKKAGELSDKGAYSLFVTSALLIAATVLALFVPGISSYSTIVLLVSYIIFAIVYTVKMI